MTPRHTDSQASSRVSTASALAARNRRSHWPRVLWNHSRRDNGLLLPSYPVPWPGLYNRRIQGQLSYPQGETAVRGNHSPRPAQQRRRPAPARRIRSGVPGEPIRYEQVRNRIIAAAGAAQAHNLPVVVNLDLRDRDDQPYLPPPGLLASRQPRRLWSPIPSGGSRWRTTSGRLAGNRHQRVWQCRSARIHWRPWGPGGRGNTSSMASSGRNAPMLATLPRGDQHAPTRRRVYPAGRLGHFQSQEWVDFFAAHFRCRGKGEKPGLIQGVDRHLVQCAPLFRLCGPCGQRLPPPAPQRPTTPSAFLLWWLEGFNLCAIQGRPRRCARQILTNRTLPASANRISP